MRIRPTLLAALTLLALLAAPTAEPWASWRPPVPDPAAEPSASWRPPVPGAVTRGFDPGRPFEAGRHRGVDLAASRGTPVRAPCAGAVAFAGAVGSAGRVVTLRCGPWRVTHLPLATIAVQPGAAIRAGALLGMVAASSEHHGLHFGVRREGARFGYADPLRFLAPTTAPSPPLGRAPRPTPTPSPRPPLPPAGSRPLVAPRPVVAPRPIVAPRRATGSNPGVASGPAAPRPIVALRRATGSNRGAASGPAAPRPIVAPADAGSNPLAPWPVWVGLALVLAGAGVRWRGGGRSGTGWAPVARRQPVR